MPTQLNFSKAKKLEYLGFEGSGQNIHYNTLIPNIFDRLLSTRPVPWPVGLKKRFLKA